MQAQNNVGRIVKIVIAPVYWGHNSSYKQEVEWFEKCGEGVRRRNVNHKICIIRSVNKEWYPGFTNYSLECEGDLVDVSLHEDEVEFLDRAPAPPDYSFLKSLKNSEIAMRLKKKLTDLESANAELVTIQVQAYKAENAGDDHLLLPVWIEHFCKGHPDVPTMKQTFSSLFAATSLSDDEEIKAKLVDGLLMADRVFDEITKLYRHAARKQKYYADVWDKKVKQWEYEAKIKKIWDENPHLPLFGAAEILAGRDPFDPANEFSPGAAGANACRNEAAARLHNASARKSSDSGYDEAPWAHQAKCDAIEARNRRIEKKNFEYDQANGCGSNRCGSISDERFLDYGDPRVGNKIFGPPIGGGFCGR